jgi:hypothetical protein
MSNGIRLEVLLGGLGGRHQTKEAIDEDQRVIHFSGLSCQHIVVGGVSAA